MPEHALKEWAVTIAALAAGDQVLIVRKGGIGEKRFELPHPRFYLFPTYAHQRPELVKPRRATASPTRWRARRPRRALPLAAYAELRRRTRSPTPSALAAIDHLHILAPTTRPSDCGGAGSTRSGRPCCVCGGPASRRS